MWNSRLAPTGSLRPSLAENFENAITVTRPTIRRLTDRVDFGGAQSRQRPRLLLNSMMSRRLRSSRNHRVNSSAIEKEST